VYSLNPKEFLTKRASILGSNFASLGRIIVGEYDKTAEIIQSPQCRSNFLGRAKLYPNKMSENFLLFLSDLEAGGNETHRNLHKMLWMSVVPSAMARLSMPVFKNYLVDLITKKFHE